MIFAQTKSNKYKEFNLEKGKKKQTFKKENTIKTTVGPKFVGNDGPTSRQRRVSFLLLSKSKLLILKNKNTININFSLKLTSGKKKCRFGLNYSQLLKHILIPRAKQSRVFRNIVLVILFIFFENTCGCG